MDNRIIMDYPNGHMELVVDKFFPCDRHAASIVFPMIRQYASDEDIMALKSYLSYCIYENDMLADSLAYQLEHDAYPETGIKGKLRSARAVRNRAARNLERLEGGRHGTGNHA